MRRIHTCGLMLSCIIYRPSTEGNEYLILKRAPERPVAPGFWEILHGDIVIPTLSPQNLSERTQQPIEQAIRGHALNTLCIHLGFIAFVNNYGLILRDGTPMLSIQLAAQIKEGHAFIGSEYSECRWILAADASEYQLLGTLTDDIVSFDARIREFQKHR